MTCRFRPTNLFGHLCSCCVWFWLRLYFESLHSEFPPGFHDWGIEEKKLAWTQHFLAQNLAGSQQLRQIMGHRQWGARVVYGDCFFITISPNEQHSSLVLRLSRFRRNDPYTKHGSTMTQKLAGSNFPDLEAKSTSDTFEAELPEYDLRRAATAKDPLAVIEGYKVEVYLRLATLLGVRMCPDCPRCNRFGRGCADKFGNNMRPGGGVLGGMIAVGGGTEHQGYGTPHLHLQGHVASVYQYGTMADVMEAFNRQQFAFDDVARHTAWFHTEDVLDAAVHGDMQTTLDEEWNSRFAAREHDDMSQMPVYLSQDHEVSSSAATVSTQVLSKAEQKILEDDGLDFKKQYLCDAQRMFCRVQHHMHKKSKKGRLPLRSCLQKNGQKKCKHGFPKTIFQHSKAILICRGIARRFPALRISGRRNAFGSLVQQRRDAYQSGTTPSFAVAFRSNSHTAPNWRLPPMPGTHCNELCRSSTCHQEIVQGAAVRRLSRIIQRAQSNCAAYFCGYTFKVQPTGKKFLKGVAESLNYLEVGMKDKTPGQQWHRITHRVLTDLQHRIMRRTAPEEWNLAAYHHDHDPTTAEFVRTYMSVDFKGGVLLRRLEAETKHKVSRETLKVMPTMDGKVDEQWLRHFDDLYGYRGKHPSVFFLNPWEFVSLWEVAPLDTTTSFPANATDRIAYPKIPGKVLWMGSWDCPSEWPVAEGHIYIYIYIY